MGDPHTQRRGTNWIEARDFWLALPPPRSFEAVARKVGVSGQRVRFVSRRDGWQTIADDIDAKALETVKRRVVRSREERNQAYLDLYDKLLDRLILEVDRPQARLRFADAPLYGRHAELVLGEATDRPDIVEVQDNMRVMLEATAPFVPRKSRAAWLEAIRKAIGWSDDT